MKRSETYELIVQKAETLFRRFGMMKTPVADIARALNMSPANIYKFFPSKRAIIEAVGSRKMLRLQQHLLAVTKSRKSAFERIKDLMFCVATHLEFSMESESDLLFVEIIRDMMQFEMARREKDWVFIKEFHAFLRNELAKLIKDGVASGEMHVPDPEDAAAALLDCLSRAIEPFLLLEDPQPARAQRLERQFRLLARALA
jgi:AcrR family transcriptional regulator